MKHGKNKNLVVARMIITFHGSAKKVIVEVHSDASFNKFYTWYSQIGRQNKSKIMNTHRGYGIEPYWRQAFETPGLELVSARYTSGRKDVKDVQIKIFRKREYNQLLTCAPDQLGGGLPQAADTAALINQAKVRRHGIPVRLPADYLTLQKRMDILTGGGR